MYFQRSHMLLTNFDDTISQSITVIDYFHLHNRGASREHRSLV